MSRSALRLLLLLLPLEATAASLQTGSEAIDTLPLVCPGAALETNPGNPDRAFVACPAVGAGEITITPGVSIEFSGTDYFLPGDLNCSESSPFTRATITNLVLDPLGGAGLRAWLVTSNCELAVPFDATTGDDIWLRYQGELRRAVPTKRSIHGSFHTYVDAGANEEISSFATNLSSDVLRIGSHLLVATSNFARAGSDPELNPGTVLHFLIDDSGEQTEIMPAVPPYIITSDPNPTALTALPGGLVAVTNTGLIDVAIPSLVTGVGSIDVIDPAAGTLLGSFPLGEGNPGARNLAVDPTGSVAVAGSHTSRQLFAIDIRGLDQLPRADIDPTLQRPSCNDVSDAEAGGLPCLRERVIADAAHPIVLPAPPDASGDAGFIVETRYGAFGDFLAATSFNDGGLAVLAFDSRNLDLPHPLLPSRFGAAQTLAATPPSGTFGIECCPGPMLLHANSAAGVDGSDVVWLTFGPTGIVSRGRLAGVLPAASGDWDADGVEDALDNCPVEPNPTLPQLDSGGVESDEPDGIGDPCQCGDVDGDGKVLESDVLAVRELLAGIRNALPSPEKCNVMGTPGPDSCDLVDLVVLTRAGAGLAPGLAQLCSPARP